MNIQKQNYYQTHKAECTAKMRERSRNIKLKVLSAYSYKNQIQCKQCGETDIRILNLDHIEGGGRQHSKKCRENGTNIYDNLIKQDFPAGFQILCPNCNHIKRILNGESRKANGKQTEVQKRYHSKLRLEVIDAYSKGKNKCNICDIANITVLCLDHIDGGGADHREKTGGVYGTWRDLKKRKFPDGMQVICHNCNRRKMHNNKEFGIRFSKEAK